MNLPRLLLEDSSGNEQICRRNILVIIVLVQGTLQAVDLPVSEPHPSPTCRWWLYLSCVAAKIRLRARQLITFTSISSIVFPLLLLSPARFITIQLLGVIVTDIHESSNLCFIQNSLLS